MRIFFVNLAALVVLVALQSKAVEIEDVIDDDDLEVCPFRSSIRTRKARVKNDGLHAEETRALQTSYAGTAADNNRTSCENDRIVASIKHQF